MGKYFTRNHGTVHQSIKKVQELLDRNDETTANILRDIRMNIEATPRADTFVQARGDYLCHFQASIFSGGVKMV